ncbi:uridine cytidine kinase [Capsaspora owczarzaki ATCC 30864]|uniref:Uridine kinase n=1 Tax=Capsaspora owczarzaki (strain ATCC 30864) TaxID=595528 RepID=A0A0D2WQ10_CAPO3|nr:uridine cytidine kinase [Capsaspora owczarzaki ATCC 30864]KJE92953.1 uridine cytidine kinase [Capsaspora owczarzaki ATCC 30864]|eukprot:XP_004363553.2 uridine cytidine kinase [Capsaspora owczarzaki ATCC 30864]
MDIPHLARKQSSQLLSTSPNLLSVDGQKMSASAAQLPGSAVSSSASSTGSLAHSTGSSASSAVSASVAALPVTCEEEGDVSCTSKVSRSASGSSDAGAQHASTKRRTIFTHGRPPWYNVDGQLKEAFVIGIAGGSASGKTTVAQMIIKELGVPWVVLLSMDSFYKALTPAEIERAHQCEYNFDHPNAFDVDLLVTTLKKLKEGKNVDIPVYDFNTHSRLPNTHTMYGANVIVFEGILAFCRKDLRDLMDMKVFVDTDSDIRLARRLKRDILERGRDLAGVIKQYNKFVKPAMDEFIAPSMNHADVVVPRGSDNHVAINLIIDHVRMQLNERGFLFREKIATARKDGPMPDTLHVLPRGSQVRAMHTIIRNRDTPRDEFIFYSQRLMRLLVEYALSFLPFQETIVTTPSNALFQGQRFNGTLIGVSIVRAGVTMEGSLRDVCKDIRLGKILIQTDEETGEPQLHYCKLPKRLAGAHILLVDATIATGAAAMMAIRVLLDHDIPEENIMFLSLIAAPSGIHNLAYAFPKVKIITTEVDREVNEQFHIIPGIGNFGDRYFGTST